MNDSRDASQAWFWTPEWQEGERRASADIAAGRVERFPTVRKIKAVAIDGEMGAWGGAENGVQVIFREGFGNKDHEYEWRLSTFDALDVIARIAAALEECIPGCDPGDCSCSGGRHK